MVSGSFFRRALVVLSLAATAARAQVTPLWETQGTNLGASWRSLSVGLDGAHVVTNLDGGLGGTSLLAGGGGIAPGSPVVWTSTSTSVVRRGVYASSASSDLHATFVLEQTQGSNLLRPRLTLRRSTAAAALVDVFEDAITAPNGTPPMGVFVDDAGTRCLIWWYSSLDFTTRWRCVGADGHTWSAGVLPTAGTTRGAVAAGDLGSFVVFAASGILHLDPSTGTLVANIPHRGTPNGFGAISRSGHAFAKANTGGVVEYYERVGGQYVFRRFIGLDSAYSIHAVALSEDGTRLVTGALELQQMRHLRIKVHGLTNGGDPVLLQDDLFGTGSLSTNVTDIVVDADGSTIAVGTTGDAGNLIPELLVYERAADGTYARAALDLAGSVCDLALAQRTRTLYAARAPAQIYSLYEFRASIAAFDLGSDFRAVGKPSVSATVRFDATAEPGTRALLLASSALAAPPGPFRNMGILTLDGPWVVGSATADAAGIARHEFTLPSGANWIGTDFHFQGLRMSPRRLSTCSVSLRVLP